ncbi:MAG: hypothetical protein AAB518_02545 [Patescibacteria group bacterium]
MDKNLIKLDDEKSVMQFLGQPLNKIAEAVIGLVGSEGKEWRLSAGKILHAAIKGNLFTQLSREIEKYREEGKIKENYFATHKSRASLYELLKFLDEEVPTEELFIAMKSIFISSISKDSTEFDESLAYEFLQTAKKLSGTEILILKANFEIAQNNISEAVSKDAIHDGNSRRHIWWRVVARQMGLGELYSIVQKYEKNLESLGLISPRNERENLADMFEPTQKFRLTEMGCKFCEFITRYK